MRIIVVILLNFFLVKTSAQQTLSIPEFENLNPNDKYPLNTILPTYANQFDIVISLKGYSNWGPDNSVKMLAFNCTGWYKIEISSDRFYVDTLVHRSIYKLSDSIGKKVWDTLFANHLFDMQDQRTKKMECIGKPDTIKRKGGKIEIVELRYDIDDGPEYEFEIITKDSYKTLYFYSPQYYNENCRKVDERTWIINCIATFEKYLGN